MDWGGAVRGRGEAVMRAEVALARANAEQRLGIINCNFSPDAPSFFTGF